MIREISKLIHEHSNYPLFGILLFSEAHPHVIKALKDKDYYSALNEITGKVVALFTTMLFLGKYEYPSPPPGVLANMVPIWKEPQQNKKIFPWFRIRDSRELPLLVIFGHESGDFYYQKIPIRDESPLDVFNSLNDVLSRISLSVQKATNENGINKQKIFEHAKWEMQKLEAHQKIKDLFETASLFRGAIGL
jgi:hypothetical protein